MNLTGLIVGTTSLFERYKYLFLAVGLLTMAAGIAIDRLVGGEPAKIAGSIQAMALVAYIFFLVVYSSFRQYGQKKDGRVPRGGQQFFVLLAVVAGYFFVGLGLSLVQH